MDEQEYYTKQAGHRRAKAAPSHFRWLVKGSDSESKVPVRRGTEATMNMKFQSGRITSKWSTIQHDKNILCSQEIAETIDAF